MACLWAWHEPAEPEPEPEACTRKITSSKVEQLAKGASFLSTCNQFDLVEA